MSVGRSCDGARRIAGTHGLSSSTIDRSIALSIAGLRLKRSFLTLVKVARPGNACPVDSTTLLGWLEPLSLRKDISETFFG